MGKEKLRTSNQLLQISLCILGCLSVSVSLSLFLDGGHHAYTWAFACACERVRVRVCGVRFADDIDVVAPWSPAVVF